jgi:competence protein ComEC
MAKQQKIIVYNVPQKRAIDFIDGRKYFFVGDPDLLEDDFVRNFHLKPSRIKHRVEPSSSITNFWQDENYFMYKNKKIWLLNKEIKFLKTQDKQNIDLLVLSGNPRIYFSKFADYFNIGKVVFDGSVPLWKIKYWKKDCDSLRIPYHDVNEKGAFVMNLR